MDITTFLWFDSDAEAAGRRYAELIPDSEVTGITRHPNGDAFVVSLEIGGHSVTLMNGGPGHPQTDAASLQLIVDGQAEVDRLWDALLADGGTPGQCGWLADRWGVNWQVVPAGLPELVSGADPVKSSAAAATMLTMRKLELAPIQDAYDRA
ncbi:VOC family protein [Nocardia panacis]|uniref:VOC family protein n=1 Tax=Nocardia panacis TaxID=2340916 RepID=A0A3A4KJ69_9NOCA|nr:VOC family protein [Nocardia panacis]RJO79910.1 VOC family protein [Nocardia panacis]